MTNLPPIGPPKSLEFDDLYFSADDGLAESKFVFLDGNKLPENWLDAERFVICETGFGTGLNFLSAWKLFEETTKPHQSLDFISFEKYPLEAEKIGLYLQPWGNFFAGRLQQLVAHYPPGIPGFHRLVLNERVTLTLIFDDINDAIPKLVADVDAWFLDGFKPSTNPEMWSDTVIENMARLSHKGTRLATFTAAGKVRRSLIAAGFSIEKVPGFGRKRDMTIGYLAGNET
ncbi:MAG: tRNA (5-methylaminomethyl-2-thiouridine)(34)-methyltransferase MnmD [Sneathiella sp.]